MSQLKDAENAEVTAVCDLWTVNRDKVVEAAKGVYGRAPQAFAAPEELLGMRDVDAVLIATPEHSHSPLLQLSVEAGKDAYCEKPMGNDLADLKAARNAVVARKRIVQIGTQHRSELYPRAAHDLVHWFMKESYPVSVIAHGGIFTWRDCRENPDTFQALLEYPKGFLVSYSTSFGNDAPSFSRYMGKQATLMNISGEGSPRYQLVEEKGVHEDDPAVYDKRVAKDVLLPGDTTPPPTAIDDNDLHHMENWLECLRSREHPHATVRMTRTRS